MALAALIFVSAGVTVYWEWVSTLLNSVFSSGGRNVNHIAAYVDGLKELAKHPFGQGIGVSSNLVGFTSKNSSTENAFINIGLETGLLGMAWFFFTFLYLFFKFRFFLSTRTNITAQYIFVASAYLLVSQFIFAGFVAPHILTGRILIPFMIIMGCAYSIVIHKSEEIDSSINY